MRGTRSDQVTRTVGRWRLVTLGSFLSSSPAIKRGSAASSVYHTFRPNRAVHLIESDLIASAKHELHLPLGYIGHANSVVSRLFGCASAKHEMRLPLGYIGHANIIVSQWFGCSQCNFILFGGGGGL
eukprot:scaffold181480_cov32-Attheya_sp.AAC.1